MSEEHIMGPSISLSHFFVSGSWATCMTSRSSLEHTVTTMGTDIIVGTPCCNNGNRGHYFNILARMGIEVIFWLTTTLYNITTTMTMDTIVAFDKIVAFVISFD
jgi:hypothetical protein